MPRSSSSLRSRTNSHLKTSVFSSKQASHISSPSIPSTPSSTPSLTPSFPVQHNVKVEQPGFFSNMWQGFGLGAGQAIAHNIFRSDPVVQHVHTPQPQSQSHPVQEKSKLEENLPKEFVQCMKEYDNNKELCKQYLN
jgi:hypothetical protein